MLAGAAETSSALLSRIAALVGVVVVFTAILHQLGPEHFSGLDDEDPDDPRERVFHRLYMVMTTLTTVGYGDVYPKSRIARAVTMALMLVPLLS